MNYELKNATFRSVVNDKNNIKRINTLIPNKSIINNKKSNKYFFNGTDNNSMKIALKFYRESKYRATTSPSPSNNFVNSQKITKNYSIKINKNLLKYAEPRTKIKEFHKLPQKLLQSVINNNTIENENNTIYLDEFLKIRKNNKFGNAKIKSMLDKNTETIIINEDDFEYNEENEPEEKIYFDIDNETYSNNNIDKNKFFENIVDFNTNMDPNKTININEEENDNNNFYIKIEKNMVNFSNFVIFEKLYNKLLLNFENNQIETLNIKFNIIKEMLLLINENVNEKLFEIFDEKCSKNDIKNPILFTIREYLIQQLIFFYFFLMINLLQNEKKIFLPVLSNLTSYFHQNFILFNYIIFINMNNSYQDDSNENYKEWTQIFELNKNSFNGDNNFGRYLKINNNLCRQIIENSLIQIKFIFNATSKDIYIKDKINLFISYIKYIHNIKYLNILQDLKNSKLLSKLSINTENNIKNNLSEIKISEKPKIPYLPPINPNYKYTLVLDLDETLVHYISEENFAYVQIRPGTEEFIKDLSKYYEIIIFTAALQIYADLVIDGIDPEKCIKYRLYRQHTIQDGDANIKNLSYLGRDLKKIIIIDNFAGNFSKNPKNGLNILDFEGNENDDALEYLKKDLIDLAKLNPFDIRDYLNDIQINMNKRALYIQSMDNDFTGILDDKINNDYEKIEKDYIINGAMNNDYCNKYTLKNYESTISKLDKKEYTDDGDGSENVIE